MNMKLGYICTNFNNSHFTVEAVRSLSKSAGTKYEIRVVVVDNQSSKKHLSTLRELADEFKNVDVIFNEENVGYFPGLNCGIRHIRKNYPDIQHLVVGNNDLLFPENFCVAVERRLEVFNDQPVVSPDVVTLDGKHQNPQVIRSISKTREIIYDLYYSNYFIAQLILWVARISQSVTDRRDELQHHAARPIYQGHGSCYLIGPKFFQYYDELWAPSFLMGEEYFLSKQLADNGMQPYFDPEIKVTHCCHGSLIAVPNRKLWQFGRKAHKIRRQYIKIFG
ncbi:glycosyltransferase [Variovorax sp. Root473]|uniref:glycosyltransferase n=1 Tax=Variovorax sp. Root473 TaxID=1736541 RepID=UPI000AD00187|nr:glycosyltransferase [Variovorax sp. Root473]